MTETASSRTVAESIDVVARNIAQLMHRRRLTETQLATAADMAPRTVGNFLRPNNRNGGDESYGLLANLIKLAMALDVEPGELFVDMDDPVERMRSQVESAFADRRRRESVESLIVEGVCVDNFSGRAADLRTKLRNANNVLRVLAESPRVSVWDRDEHSWLDRCLRDLEKGRLIRETGEPYPWYRYELTADGHAALAVQGA